MDSGGGGVSDDHVAQTSFAPSFRAEALLALRADAHAAGSHAWLVLQDEDRYLVLAQIVQHLADRIVLEIDDPAAHQLEGRMLQVGQIERVRELTLEPRFYIMLVA